MTDKDHIPIAAFKRLAQDLNSSRRKSELYAINKKRIQDFIESPYQKPMYQSILRQPEEEKTIEEPTNVLAAGVHIYPLSSVRIS